jgi:hypothetical protein
MKAVSFGFGPDYLVDLPLPSFNLLAEDMLEVEAREKVERAWVSMVAAQGDAKTMQEQVKPWVDVIKKSQKTKASGGDFAKALKQKPKLGGKRGGRRGR